VQIIAATTTLASNQSTREPKAPAGAALVGIMLPMVRAAAHGGSYTQSLILLTLHLDP
jgi:hypothetical protein